jgi:hypothetical protein
MKEGKLPHMPEAQESFNFELPTEETPAPEREILPADNPSEVYRRNDEIIAERQKGKTRKKLEAKRFPFSRN